MAFFVFGMDAPEPSIVARLSFRGLDDGDDVFYISNDGGEPIEDAGNNLILYVGESELSRYARGMVLGDDNDLDVGETMRVEGPFFESGRVRVTYVPAGAVIAESESVLRPAKKLGILIVDNETGEPIDDVTITGEINSRTIDFKVNIVENTYYYKIWDDRTSPENPLREGTGELKGGALPALALENLLGEGEHSVRLRVHRPGYETVEVTRSFRGWGDLVRIPMPKKKSGGFDLGIEPSGEDVGRWPD